MSAFIMLLGVIGAVTLLTAYGLVSTAKISGDGVPYQLLNFGGSITMMINSGYHSAWPSAVLNMVWGAIGTVAIGRIIASRARARGVVEAVSTQARSTI
jgi:hypothetical protein